MHKATSPILGLIMVIFVVSCGTIPAPVQGEMLQGNVTISGAFALYPMVTRWVQEFQQLNPAVHFDISSGGAGKGMDDILAGKADIGMVSREITPEEEKQGAYPVAVAKDAVFPLVNTANPVLADLLSTGVKRDVLTKIFITGEITSWGEVTGKTDITNEIHVYTRSDICGAAATWSLYLGGVQSDLLGKGKFGDPGMVQALQDDPLGIGYNNLIYAYGLGDVPPQGTVILPLDLNENGQVDPDEMFDTRAKAVHAIESGLYPAPPARTLYLVTSGKPQGAVQAFLEWLLTDGQQYVDPAGYVQLSPETLNNSLGKIR